MSNRNFLGNKKLFFSVFDAFIPDSIFEPGLTALLSINIAHSGTVKINSNLQARVVNSNFTLKTIQNLSLGTLILTEWIVQDFFMRDFNEEKHTVLDLEEITIFTFLQEIAYGAAFGEIKF